MLRMAKKEKVLERRELISLADLAKRFSKAKGMDTLGYSWLRKSRSAEEGSTGNGLAVLKALRSFNQSNDPITVYKVAGYDGTNKSTLAINKSEVIRLKGFLLRGASGRKGRSPQVVEFRVIEEVAV